MLTQIYIISMFVPAELAKHFFVMHQYVIEEKAQFGEIFGDIANQLHAAQTNQQQQIVVDIDAFRTKQEKFQALISNELGNILACIKPQLTTGRANY